MSDLVLSGGCLSGLVRFNAMFQMHDVTVCHCSMCRRWSGGTFMAVPVEPELQEVGEGKVSAYPSSEWGERLFCNQCGTSIGWRMRDGSSMFLAVSSFDKSDDFVFKTEIFYDHKPAFYSFANDTKKYTEAEFLARFVQQGD